MKKHFITGLVILLPLAVTVVILGFLVDLLTAPFMGVTEAILEQFSIAKTGILFLTGAQVKYYGGKILVLLALFAFTVFLGIIGRWFFFHWLFRVGDFILHKIPLVNKVYKTSQEVIKTIFASNAQSFKKVVMVPFPLNKAFCIGLVSSTAPKECKESANENLVSVFVPTTPNPTSGYLLMYREEDIIYLDMKVEDAIKLIISCGVIHPSSLDPSMPGLGHPSDLEENS